MIPLFLSGLALASPQASGEPLMLRPQPVVDSLRIAITPLLDGVVTEQEWDLLAESDQGPVFFQWEPGKLHWAAKPKPGNDVVLSLDLKGDGWLVGNDNLEIRTRLVGETLETTIRQLDATDRNGPQWLDPRLVPNSVVTRARGSATFWNLEGSITPVEIAPEPALDQRVGVRVDIVPTGADTGPAFMPRNLALLRLRFDKSRNLFSGLTWRPEVRSRSVARLDPLRFRINFTRDEEGPAVQTVDIVGEGYARDVVNQATVPFPQLDRRGRGFVDYASDIKPDALAGYRVLRATLLAADGRIATIRTSFRVSELVEIEPRLPRFLPYSEQAQTLRADVNLRSQALGRIEGRFDYILPETWTPRRGQSSDFLIFHSRGSSRQVIEFTIPPAVTGPFPVVLNVKIGDREVQKIHYIVIR